MIMEMSQSIWSANHIFACYVNIFLTEFKDFELQQTLFSLFLELLMDNYAYGLPVWWI